MGDAHAWQARKGTGSRLATGYLFALIPPAGWLRAERREVGLLWRRRPQHVEPPCLPGRLVGWTDWWRSAQGLWRFNMAGQYGIRSRPVPGMETPIMAAFGCRRGE